jgi:branched-chain amino acid aminotransferase
MNDASRASLYGSGVFTTIRIVDGQPWLWHKHWHRLIQHAGKLGLDLSNINKELVRKELDRSLEIDKLRDGRARITLHDARVPAIWADNDAPDDSTTLNIVTGEMRVVVRPFRTAVSSHAINSTSPISGLKTCNYLEQMMSLDQARSKGLNEALRLNEHGHVASACMANVFWVRNERSFTPSLSTGCLPGTTREFLMEKLDVTEVEAEIDEIKSADAIFLTSAGLGIVQVDEFDGREMGPMDHEITALISKSQ